MGLLLFVNVISSINNKYNVVMKITFFTVLRNFANVVKEKKIVIHIFVNICGVRSM